MNSRGRLLAIMTLALAVPSAAQAQRLGGAAGADVSLVRVFLALLFCLTIAVLAVFLIRQRFGGRLPAIFSRMGSNTSRIRLVESRRIAPQSDLCLIECDGQEYLLLITAGGPLLLRDRAADRERAE